MFNDNDTHTIELQENDEEIFRGEKDIRLRDDLVMNDQTETKAKERTVLQENGRREGLREETKNGTRANGNERGDSTQSSVSQNNRQPKHFSNSCGSVRLKPPLRFLRDFVEVTTSVNCIRLIDQAARISRTMVRFR